MANRVFWWMGTDRTMVPVLAVEQPDGSYALGLTAIAGGAGAQDRLVWMLGADGQIVPVLARWNGDDPPTYRIAADVVGAGSSGPISHTDLINVTADQHHPQQHGHTATDGSGQISHSNLIGVTADQHHPQQHGHTATDGSGQISHSNLIGVTADQHHPQAHAHDGVDGSGTVSHASLTGVTADQHHPQQHGHTATDGSGQISHSNLIGVTADQHHAEQHNHRLVTAAGALTNPDIFDSAVIQSETVQPTLQQIAAGAAIYPRLYAQCARGTLSAPAAVQVGDTIYEARWDSYGLVGGWWTAARYTITANAVDTYGAVPSIAWWTRAQGSPLLTPTLQILYGRVTINREAQQPSELNKALTVASGIETDSLLVNGPAPAIDVSRSGAPVNQKWWLLGPDDTSFGLFTVSDDQIQTRTVWQAFRNGVTVQTLRFLTEADSGVVEIGSGANLATKARVYGALELRGGGLPNSSLIINPMNDRAQIFLVNNVDANSNKALRVASGRFEIIDHAYTKALFAVDDAGVAVIGNRLEVGTTPVLETRLVSYGSLEIKGGGEGGSSLIINPANQIGQIWLNDNTNTNPGRNKFLRVYAGQFQIINHAYSQALLSVDDNGNVFIPGAWVSPQFDSGQAWLPFTPGAVTQGTATLTMQWVVARYKRVGRLIQLFALGRIAAGTGQTGAYINVHLGDAPSSAATYASDVAVLGTYVYRRTGVTYYVGAAIHYPTGYIKGLITNNGDFLGATPSFAAQVDDLIAFSITYEL